MSLPMNYFLRRDHLKPDDRSGSQFYIGQWDIGKTFRLTRQRSALTINSLEFLCGRWMIKAAIDSSHAELSRSGGVMGACMEACAPLPRRQW